MEQLDARRRALEVAPLSVDGAHALTHCSLAPTRT
jgi:hypothetical protein